MNMSQEPKFYRCEICGNIVEVVNEGAGVLVCCGNDMTELKANSTDAAGEKHVPVANREGTRLTVKIGSVAHPMIPEHYIQWVYVYTRNGGQRRVLTPNDPPEAIFSVECDEPVSVYAYCNLHGLWQAGV
jgi:superoxide reductase